MCARAGVCVCAFYLCVFVWRHWFARIAGIRDHRHRLDSSSSLKVGVLLLKCSSASRTQINYFYIKPTLTVGCVCIGGAFVV